MHMLHSTAARDPNEAALFLVVHGGVRRLPDGRPLLHVSYVDHAAAERMYPTERSQQEPVRRWVPPPASVAWLLAVGSAGWMHPPACRVQVGPKV